MEMISGSASPFPLIGMLRKVLNLGRGETLSFLVDDLLAARSIPRELEDYGDICVDVAGGEGQWKVTVSRNC